MLEINHLSVQLQTQRGPAFAIRDVSFTLEQGDTVGLVGESGCGKSITAMALMGLLPESAKVTGSIRLDGQELVGQSDAVLRRLRGEQAAAAWILPFSTSHRGVSGKKIIPIPSAAEGISARPNIQRQPPS